ncbi:MAG: hypothetical protein IAE86_21380, partial [Burkholderiaceae bacterium]|nr:hypothetical protein [Burkholderiaceae bacterium]
GIDPAYGVTKQCDLQTAGLTSPRVAKPEPAPPKAPPPPPEPVFVAPLVISKGGTYSANWESQDPKVAAVTVSTTEPVVIENCRLRGKGHLVLALRDNTNITVRNCIGEGLNPNVVNTRTGRFVSVYKPGTLVVERNTMLGTGGIYADGAGATAKGITVRYNRAQNIEGRLSDGKGGYLSDFVRMQFVQFNNVRATKNVEVAWNQVINEIGKSRVEDNINIYLSSGTADSPMQIHDNYIQGAYPADPATPKFSGGGIIIDGGTSNLQQAAGFVRIHGNQVVSTTNYGIAIAAGHDIDVRDNRVVSSGKLSDGRKLAAANVGSYVSNGYGYPGTFFNNGVTANTIGWINASGNLNNSWFPDCPGNACQGNAYMTGSVTVEMEAAEYTSWQQKLAAAGLKVGSSLEP